MVKLTLETDDRSVHIMEKVKSEDFDCYTFKSMMVMMAKCFFPTAEVLRIFYNKS